jgi:hypothetical protein
MSSLGLDISVKLDLALRKSRSEAKIVNLGPDKIMACKLNTTELRAIKGTTRSNLNIRNHPRVKLNSKQEQI